MRRVKVLCTLGTGGGPIGWADSVSGGGAIRDGGTGIGIGAAGASTFGGGATHGVAPFLDAAPPLEVVPPVEGMGVILLGQELKNWPSSC